MSKCFKSLEMLYKKGFIDKSGLQKAVQDGKITALEYLEITGKKYSE